MSLNDGNILFSILQLVPLWPTLDTVADTLLIPKDTEVTEQEDVVEAAAAAIASVAIIPSLYVVQRLFYSHAFNSIYDPTSTFYFVFSKVTVLGAWCVYVCFGAPAWRSTPATPHTQRNFFFL